MCDIIVNCLIICSSQIQLKNKYIPYVKNNKEKNVYNLHHYAN